MFCQVITGKYEGAEKSIEKMKEIQEEAKVALGKVQEEIKNYADRKRAEVNSYKVGDLVMLSTKNLKYQMVGKRTEKLTERFIGPYKIKKIVSSNYHKWSLTICDGCFDTLKSSKMRN